MQRSNSFEQAGAAVRAPVRTRAAKRGKLLRLLVLSGCCAASQLAWAGCSRVPDASEKLVNMDMGTVVIDYDLPVGNVIQSQQFPIPIVGSPEKIWDCEQTGGTLRGTMLQGSPVYGYSNVYSTDVSGVGVRLSRRINDINGNPTNTYYPHTISLSAGENAYFVAPSYFQVELVKIAQRTGSGKFARGTYTTYSGDDGISALTTVLNGIGITIVTPSCKTQDVQVRLDSFPLNEFKAIGTTTAKRAFSIPIRCQTSPQNVSLVLDASRDPSNIDGVLRVNSGNNTATGVGIQVLKRDGTPIKFGQAIPVGPSIDTVYQIPFSARYYQTSKRVTPGRADGEATFTLTYQ
jgi:type 1 fimbria pilin